MQLILDIKNTKDPMTEKSIVIKDCSAEDVAYYINTLENRKILGHYNGTFSTNKLNVLRYWFEQCSFLHDNERNILYVKQDDEALLDKLSEFNASYIPPKINSMQIPEAIELLDNLIGMVEDNHNSDYDMALKLGIKALKELQSSKQILEQYESLGTPTQILEKIGGLDVELGKYACLGTVEEFREALDKASAYDEFLAEQDLLEENPDILRR